MAGSRRPIGNLQLVTKVWKSRAWPSQRIAVSRRRAIGPGRVVSKGAKAFSGMGLRVSEYPAGVFLR